MLDPRIAVEQLTEYFGRAEGDSGLRSPFGFQLESARTGIEFDRSFPRTDDKMVSLMDRQMDHRAVHRRLRRLPPEHQNILAAAYGDVMPVGATDVSVSLAIGTQKARDAHEASVNGAKARLASGDAHKGDWGAARTSPKEWFEWICAASSGPRAELMDLILEEARRIRTGALEAYCAADMDAAEAA